MRASAGKNGERGYRVLAEAHNAAEIDRGAEPKIRDQERTLAERLISELSGREFHPENYGDEHRKRLMKAREQKVAGQEIGCRGVFEWRKGFGTVTVSAAAPSIWSVTACASIALSLGARGRRHSVSSR